MTDGRRQREIKGGQEEQIFTDRLLSQKLWDCLAQTLLHHVHGNRFSPDYWRKNGTFPSWFLNVPRAFSCLQVTTISDRGFLATTYYNPCIRQMSHREDGQTLVASFLRELGFRFIMAACQAWECVFLRGSANQSLIFEMRSLMKKQTWNFQCLSCRSISSQNWCDSWTLTYMLQWGYHFCVWRRHFMRSSDLRQVYHVVIFKQKGFECLCLKKWFGISALTQKNWQQE